MGFTKMKQGTMTMGKLDKFALGYEKFELFLLAVGCIGLFFMMLITVSDVVGRYFFRAPIPWSMYLCSDLQVAISFLGLGYVQAKKAHIHVDLVEHLVPKRFHWIFNLLAYIALTLITVIIMWQGWNNALHSFQMGETELAGTMNILIWPWKFFVPFGTAVLLVQLVIDLLRIKSVIIAGESAIKGAE
jgi:TRAP-type C4-dicarboxylate transport system permease small subunit